MECVVRMRDRLSCFRFNNTSHNCRRVTGSRPVVGSSEGGKEMRREREGGRERVRENGRKIEEDREIY